MKKALVFILTICMAAMLFPATASADDGVLGGTGITVYPIQETQVEMEKEIIDILVKDGRTYVSCQFFFHNTGKKTKLLVGFPCGYPDDPEAVQAQMEQWAEDPEYKKESVDDALYRFRTYIQGERATVKVKDGLKPGGNNSDSLYYPKWYAWNMTFAAGQRIKVTNSYWMKNSIGGENGEGTGYILRSGSTWKGPIGKVTVRMRFQGYNLFDLFFEGMAPTSVKDDGTILWEAKNIEPEEDIQANFKSGGESLEIYNPFQYGTPEYNVYSMMGERLMRNFTAGHFNGATWWGHRFIGIFGDKQSDDLYYVLGLSYFKLGKYAKALEMLNKVQDEEGYATEVLYYKALIYKKSGDTTSYKSSLEALAENNSTIREPDDEQYTDWVTLWAQSRLKELEKAK